MAFCRHCGGPIQEGANNCGSCGASVAGSNPATTQAVPATQPPAAEQAMPTVAVSSGPNVFAVMWASFGNGGRIAGIGGLVAAVSFFLPFYSGEGYSQNGVNIAEGDFTIWFRLLFALLAVGLLWFEYNNDLRTKVIVGAVQLAIGATYGIAFFQVMRGGDYTSASGFGWYFNHLGFLAIAVGGFLSVLDSSRRLAGVR